MKFRNSLLLALGVVLATSLLGTAAGPVPLPPAPARPDEAAGPTRVAVTAWFADILKIDSAAQTFAVNMVLLMRWRDPAMATNSGPARKFALADIWSPQWIAANSAGSLENSLPEIAAVTGDGSALYRQRILGSFTQSMNLRRFPFDRETFRVNLVIPGYRPEDVELVPDPDSVKAGLAMAVGRAKDLTLQDWQITGLDARAKPYEVVPGTRIAGYEITFTAARKPNHYLLKVILPLVLIVIMSWAVFWIDPSLGSTQISVAVTSMLTLIAYRFAVGAEIPKLPYLTLLDSFILLSSVLVFVSLIEVMVITRLALNNRLETARAIDRHSRWIFPAAFVLLTALLVRF